MADLGTGRRREEPCCGRTAGAAALRTGNEGHSFVGHCRSADLPICPKARRAQTPVRSGWVKAQTPVRSGWVKAGQDRVRGPWRKGGRGLGATPHDMGEVLPGAPDLS